MILLEFHNRIVEETASRAFQAEKAESVNVVASDFDGVLYHLYTGDDRANLFLSLRWACYPDLEACNVQRVLEREYGPLLAEPEPGYHVTLMANLANPPLPWEEVVRKFAYFKRNLFAAPFETCFDQLLDKKVSPAPLTVNYRADSALYILAQADRVTAIFSISFQDTDDTVIGRVFLQEFVDARKKVQEAPQVIISKDPPAELACLGLSPSPTINYVSFVLFARHFKGRDYRGPPENDPQREHAINMLETFRDYLQYHVKCSKAHLHCRMRARVADELKIINRAKPEVKTEKKTASGKSFIRK